MNIFHKRPLSLILCIALGSFALAAMTAGALAIIVTAAIFICALISFIIPKTKKIIRCALVVALIFSILPQLRLSTFIYKPETDDAAIIVGKIENITAETNYKISAEITTQKIGERAEVRKINAEFYETEDFPNIKVGNVLEFYGTLKAYTIEKDAYYVTRGFSAYCRDGANVSVVLQESPALSYKIAQYRKQLADRMCSLTNQDSGGFLAALLLGERDYLDGETRLNFERLGITHVLAISGLHLAILTAFLMKFLSLFGLSKKIKSAISILFVLAYMAFTGFPLSVCRAGIMLILSLFLYLLSSSYDGITALFVSVTVIILINPLALFDLSLQLSASATFGVLVANEYLGKAFNTYPVPKIKRIISPLVVSLFAISAILAISVSTFSSFSVISPFATIIFSFLAEIYMILGVFVTLLGQLLPIGKLLTYLYVAVDKPAAFFSAARWVAPSVEFPVARALAIIITISLLAFAVLKIKKKRIYLCSVLALIAVFFGASSLMTELSVRNTSVCAYSGGADLLKITDSREVAFVDVSSYTVATCGYKTDCFAKNHITYIDKYLFTHYTKHMPAFAKAISEDIKIGKIYLPTPRNSEEELIANTLKELIFNRDIKVIYYGVEEAVSIGNISIFESYRSEYGDGAVRCILSILDGDQLYSYHSSGVLEDGEINKKASEIIADSDAVILGCHGKSYSFGKFTVISEKIKKIVVFSENLYFPEEIGAEYSDGVIVYPENGIFLIH